MKGRIRLATLAAFVATFCTSLAGAATAEAACRAAVQPPSRSTLEVATQATLCLVNQVRRAHHLQPLKVNESLDSIAAGQSYDMHLGGYFGDDSLSGLTPMQRVEASAYGRDSSRLAVAQNIAWGEGGEAAPGAIVASWLSSGPHREILLASNYKSVGVGISLGAPSKTEHKAGAIYTIDLAAR